MRERDAEAAGRADPLRDLAKQLNRHGGDPLALEFGSDQTHGLVARRSDGDEERDVDLIFDQASVTDTPITKEELLKEEDEE